MCCLDCNETETVPSNWCVNAWKAHCRLLGAMTTLPAKYTVPREWIKGSDLGGPTIIGILFFVLGFFYFSFNFVLGFNLTVIWIEFYNYFNQFSEPHHSLFVKDKIYLLSIFSLFFPNFMMWLDDKFTSEIW